MRVGHFINLRKYATQHTRKQVRALERAWRGPYPAEHGSVANFQSPGRKEGRINETQDI
jgi:hypothetical protein